MSNLSNILNPENSRTRSQGDSFGQADSVSEASNAVFALPTSPVTYQQRETRTRNGDSYSALPYDHAPHPDCPDTLACLPDTNGRPQHTLPVILRCAILGSPRKRLTIREIYAAMEEKYDYYKTAGPTWKQSVRHHLSLNRLFERQPRPVTEPGFGSYWTVNLAAPPGTKRPRKRGRGNKDPIVHSNRIQPTLAPIELQAPHFQGDNGAEPPVSSGSSMGGAPFSANPHRPLMGNGLCGPAMLHNGVSNPPPISPQGFGHPSQILRRESNARGSTPSSHEGDGLDRRGELYAGMPPGSADEYDSENDSVHVGPPYERRDSLPRPAYPPLSRDTRPLTLPPLASLNHHDVENGDSGPGVIERLRAEIDSLRRQSAEAVSVSLRLSEQLSQAQGEVSHARSTVREMEQRLGEETYRRKEAERLADEETKRRRAAEEAYESANASRPPPLDRGRAL